MPEISHFYGIFIYMYFSEHNPPHFHVKYNEYTAEISIKDGIVTGSLPRRALNLVFCIGMNSWRTGNGAKGKKVS